MIERRRSHFMFAASALWLTMTACSEQRNSTDGPSNGSTSTAEKQLNSSEPIAETSGVAPAMLTEAQLAEYSKAALDGDGQSAFLVLIHYEMAMLDRRNGEYWAQIAAENGHLDGIVRCAAYLLDVPESESCRRARFWVRRAMQIAGPEDSGNVSTFERQVESKCSKFVSK